MSTGRGGRERSRRDYHPRSEEKSHHSRSNPPSRHLWVGNLSHSLSESALANQFLRFGELETVAFQPGRSYAFINFKNEEGAFAAIRQLQGYVVSGNPLRIEFAKPEKSSPPPRDEDYFPRRDERSRTRGSPLSQRDLRMRHSSPEPLPHSEKSRLHDKSGEPSEVLWIGFPAQLKVDEFILRKAFSPFGEIDKITAFPGRPYAFVRFRNVMAACRAKETLQGKLFGNPRVHICFSRTESGPSNRERSSMNDPSPPHMKSYGHIGSSANFHQDRDFGNISGDRGLRSPPFISDFDPGDPRLGRFSRKGDLWEDEDGALDQRRFPAPSSDLGPVNAYEHRSPPPRNRVSDFREFSPQQFHRQDPFNDDSWDLPEDPLVFRGVKKLKSSSYLPENELPEYPFSDSEQGNHRMYSDFSQPEFLDKNFDSGPLVHRQIPDRIMNSNLPHGGDNDRWNPSYEGFKVGGGQLASNAEQKRSTPEPHPSSLNGEWKWEGTIAKGGTPVCRARCFPVGKPINLMILPEFLDCTARTSLDMLAKHYYQAADSWVVFFVAASDPDMAFYNEFMNYLCEKQRAAVAKLDDRTTLFLVPPSDFSEKVLKVPGKLSISGVVLRLEAPGSSFGSLHQQPEKKDTSFTSFQGMPSYAKPISPSVPNNSLSSYQSADRPGISNMSFSGTTAGPSAASISAPHHGNVNFSESFSGDRHNYMINQHNPSIGQKWSSHDMQNLHPGAKNISSQSSNVRNDPTISQVYNPAMPTAGMGNSNIYRGEVSSIPFNGNNQFPPEERTHVPSSVPAPLQSEQLAQLASSIFGQQRQSGVASMGQDFKQPGNNFQSENSYRPQQNFPPPSNQAHEFSSSQFGQVQQFQQQQQQQHQQPTSSLPPPPPPPRELQHGTHLSHQLQNASDEETDPQKRLQATLQLAASLLHQIQQGKGAS